MSNLKHDGKHRANVSVMAGVSRCRTTEMKNIRILEMGCFRPSQGNACPRLESEKETIKDLKVEPRARLKTGGSYEVISMLVPPRLDVEKQV